MRVAVLGCAGYLGSVLCNKLLNETKIEVVGLGRCYSAPCDAIFNLIPNPRFKFIGADATIDRKIVESLIKSVDCVVNLIGLVGEPICKKYPEECYRINRDLASTIASYGTNLIFASTGSVYGAVEGTVCTELSSAKPVSDYAIAKLEAERLIAASPANYLIYRFGTAFGLSPKLRLDLLVNDLTYRAMKERSLTVFQSHYKRSFVHVRDIVDSIVHGINNFNVMNNNVYNVSNERGNWSKGQLAEYLKEKTGCEVFYGDKGYVDSDVRNYEFSTKKINSTGWSAKVTVEQGIDELISAYPAMSHHGPFHKA